MLDLGSAVGYLLLDTSKFDAGLQTAKAGLKTFMDDSQKSYDRLSGLGSAMSTIGTNMTKYLTLPIIGVGTAALKMGNDFEAQMSRVKAISGATAEEFEALNDLALQLGAETSFSASEAAAGMENLASAGFTVNEIMNAMPGLLDLAASSGADLATSSEIAASTIRGFGLEAEDAAHVADVFAEAAARTNAQTEDMGEAMKYIAPVANAMGQSLEETAAAIGIMSDAGIKGGQAGTSLRGALSRLAKPTDEMVDKMDELGLSFYDSEGNMLSLVDIVAQLETNMSDLTQEQRNNALVTLFGQESLSGMLALMDRGSGELDTLARHFEDVDGAASDMADTMLDNTSGAIEEMMGSIETLAITVQQVMAPVVTAVVKKITEMVNKFNAMSDSQKKVIVAIAGFVAVLGPVILIIGKLVTAVSGIVSVISGAKGAVAAIKTLMTTLGASVGPIMAVIAAVGLLVAAWATNFGGIRDKTAEIMGSISAIISSVLSFIKSLWDNNFLGIKSIVENAFAAIEAIFSDALELIVAAFDVFEKAFTGDWQGLFDSVINLLKTFGDLLLSLVGNLLNFVVDSIISFGVRFFKVIGDVLAGAGQVVIDLYTSFMDWWEKALDDPVQAVRDIGSAMLSAGEYIMNSLLQGLQNVWSGIVDWVSSAVDWVVSKVAFWQSESAKVNAGQGAGRRTSGSHSSGLDYVPYNGYVAELHEGEAVLTKQQNEQRNKQQSGGDTYNFYSPKPIDAVTARREIKRLKVQLAEGLA